MAGRLTQGLRKGVEVIGRQDELVQQYSVIGF